MATNNTTAVKDMATLAIKRPKSVKTLPPMKDDASLWTKKFVEFVARRGYEFNGRMKLLTGLDGREVAGLTSAKAAVNKISSMWPKGLEDAVCVDAKDGKSSSWKLLFKSSWNLDKRIPGFWIAFTVDAPGRMLVKEFESAEKKLTQEDWPPATSPYAVGQKDWEGELIVHRWFKEDACVLDRLIACLRAGGNPFAKIGRELLGHPNRYHGGGSAETKVFMDAFRDALGPREGWHLRIAPLLTDAGIQALMSQINLGTSTPAAKTAKKSLKDRKDVI